MALYGAFIVIPTAFALFLSFTNWNVDGPIKWAGFANWSEFFSDPVSYHSLLVTFELAGLSWLAQTPMAMALGIFIAGTQRYRAVYAALYLLPLLLSTAGLSLMWEDVLFPQFGGLAWLGIHAHHALPQPGLAGQPRPGAFHDRRDNRLAVRALSHSHFSSREAGYTDRALRRRQRRWREHDDNLSGT